MAEEQPDGNNLKRVSTDPGADGEENKLLTFPSLIIFQSNTSGEVNRSLQHAKHAVLNEASNEQLHGSHLDERQGSGGSRCRWRGE